MNRQHNANHASVPSAVNSSRNGNGFSNHGSDEARIRAIHCLEEAGFSKTCTKGETLFLEGAAARGLYLLASGRAKVSLCSADGRKVIMRIAGRESILGLYAALTGRDYEATAEMLETGRVIFVPRRDLLELIARHPWFGRSMVDVFSHHFSELVEHARMTMLSESAVERLARLIVKWGEEFGERTNGGIRLKVLLTQEEIAQIIGASRETVTRLFSSLKRKEIIHVNGGGMLIRNSAALAALAQLPDGISLPL
jgi:CRP/FNR family transcriptional regulator